jgi:hypothetical protein
MFNPGRNDWRFLCPAWTAETMAMEESHPIGSDRAGLADPIERCIYMNLYEI